MKLLIDPEQELLERTLRAARRVQPPPSDEVEVRRRVEHAVEAARAFETRRRRLALGAGVLGAGALAAAAALWVVVSSARTIPSPGATPEARVTSGPEGSASSAAPEERPPHALPSGDHLYAELGARYEIDATNLHRRVRLLHGEVRFDVASLAGGSFRVDAGDVTVRVRGTVFSVRFEDELVEVEVFEGVVEVHRGDTLVRLGLGGRWSSAEREPTPHGSRSGPANEVPRVEDRSSVRSSSHGSNGRSDRPRRPLTDVAAEAASETDPSRAAASLAEARERLFARDFDGALEAAADRDDVEWRLLRADALRGLGRSRDAARAYDEAAALLSDARRAQAGYAAARIWSTEEHDFEAALTSLTASRATLPGSPIEERARALELELLRRLGRDTGDHAEAYQRRFGEGPSDSP